ncbi:hypothetical protein JVT61DRAFT_1854 [Boletus reticuloceps]|uniref:Uncharacterized protein n=1 Tax=Boletus reticuloceps TaxID=495285 RepID=A0A8I2YTR1_9AGAM|nr:hypothetical protein JVT61DRAFT_1854 [Boletus reticuloceps]
MLGIQMIHNLRAVTAFFRRSSQASEKLEAVRQKMGISRGLEGIGKTRFATICTAVISLQRCFVALRELVDKNLYKFPPKKALLANLFKSGSVVGLTFGINVNWFIQLGGPIAKSIICLESTQSNPADPYKYWVAICGSIKQTLDKPKNGFTSHNAGLIRAVVNAHFCEQLQEGPTDCYLAAFALEPRYIHSVFLHSHPSMNLLAITLKVPPLMAQQQVSKTSPKGSIMQSPALQRVLKYLKHVLEMEWRSKHNPILKGMSVQDIQSSFLRQFERYVTGVYPFEVPIEERESLLVYWHNLTLNKDSAVLACIAEKLFSIKPNSMPEERTMSVFTRMNSAVHNHQQVCALVDMTQIRQWHTYDPEHQVHEYPTVSFYDLDSLLNDIDGDEELDEDDTGTSSWLNENKHAQAIPDICFEVEQDINLEAAIATQVLEERGPVPEKTLDENMDTGVVEGEGEGDNDYTWNW